MNKQLFLLGGTSPIGQRIALLYGARGYDVAFVYRQNHILADALCHRLAGYNVKCEKICADLSDLASVDVIAEQAPKTMDVYINAIAIKPMRQNFADMQAQRIMDEVNAGFTHPLLLLHRLMGRIKDNGLLINMGSKVVDTGGRQIAVYAATRGAWSSFSKGLSFQLAHRGIRVHNPNPPAIDEQNLDEIANLFI